MAATATKGARITGEKREKLGATAAKKYARGKSIREIAEESGRSYGFVHRLLTEQPDVTIRPRGGAVKKVTKRK